MTNIASRPLRLFVATSTLESPGPFKDDQQFAYAWALVDEAGKAIASDRNPFGDGGRGDHTKGVFPAIRSGLSFAAEGALVEVITGLKYVRDLLNSPSSERRLKGYRRSDKKPLADKAELIALDGGLEERGISISGRGPSGDDEEVLLAKLQTWAHEKARNSGLTPSDWNL
ncbi:hypothetical protein LB533_16245 [Mesorhizobium sp. BR1-1-13]|uniref:hypothetical protein n=1 Tax=Mesorhizobium sp. BR1-1-13 TaxID=2876656 RepID=UPI001CD06A65|nr:hypothetical protein [Mesorhizobium sp. BR1-1-13]MBZ9942643.1 hypothetical protein [Mesorhizobium sp. BR1-1-13]